jgi:transposase
MVHRVSRRGNRKLNHALHMAAITQLRNPGTQGRIYFERKLAEGKTKKEAIRSLKRQISNSVYRRLLLDARSGVREDTRERLVASVTGSTP